MKKFEIDKMYSTQGVTNNQSTLNILVLGRSEKTLVYLYDGEKRRSKLRSDANGEYIQPDNYSMAPVFRADSVIQHREKVGCKIYDICTGKRIQ